MSFGVGVGDILTITKIGFKLWVNVSGAKKEREDLAANLNEWRDRLKLLDTMLANTHLLPSAANHAKGQLSEALLTLQILEELNDKLVKGKAFRRAAWEVCGREEFEKYQAGLKERVETIDSVFLGGSMALVTDTVRENNVILRRLENGMQYQGFSPDYEPIRFIDALNGQRLLPWENCRTWEHFQFLIQTGFKESAGKSFVERGEYDIINEESGALLKMEQWSNIIKPGILLSMAIVIRKQVEKGKNDHMCPGCNTRYTGSVGIGNELERVKCTYCRRWFQVSSEPRIREIDTTEEPKGLGSGASSGEPAKDDELMHIQRFHVRVDEIESLRYPWEDSDARAERFYDLRFRYRRMKELRASRFEEVED